MAQYGDDNSINKPNFYDYSTGLGEIITHVVKRTYLEKLTILPRMQDIPESAFLNRVESPIFILHRWLNDLEPKPETLEYIKKFIPNQEKIGLWIDYCCLPQKGRDNVDDRTQMQKEYFIRQLQLIPTLISSSQIIILWDHENSDRAWCVMEYLIAVIFLNLIRKQFFIYRDMLWDSFNFYTQTYNPYSNQLVVGNIGKPIAMILIPYEIRDLTKEIYKYLQNLLRLPPTLLTSLLQKVEMTHIDRPFKEFRLTCSKSQDLDVLKAILLNTCRYVGSFRLSGYNGLSKISAIDLMRLIKVQLSNFTLELFNKEYSNYWR